jgi:hypothetical protein
MKKLCAYVKAHHRDFGVALFVIPMTLVVFAMWAAAEALATLVR